MKVRECMCGIGAECTGVSAAFRVLDDPRAGHTSLPRYIEDEFRSQVFADNNRLREATLRHILSPDQDPESIDDKLDKLYIANHHFHPKIVHYSTPEDGVGKCKIPMFISEEDNKKLHIGFTDEERVLDADGKPTGGYYIVPNYPFEKAKKDLNSAVKRLRLAKQIVHESREFGELEKCERKKPIGFVIIPSGHDSTDLSVITGHAPTTKRGKDHPEDYGNLDDSKETTDETVDLSTEEGDDYHELSSNEVAAKQDGAKPTEDEPSSRKRSLPVPTDMDGFPADEREESGKSLPTIMDECDDQDELLLTTHICRMGPALSSKGSYSFEFRDFDLLMEAPETGVESGVLMSTAVGRTCDSDDPEAHSDDCMEKALEANRKLNEKTGSTAYLGTRNNEIILYLYSLSPRNPPDYAEFEQAIVEFLVTALEIQSQMFISMEPKNELSQKQCQETTLNTDIQQMDQSLDTKGSYSFEYRDFNLLMEAPEAGDKSGILMSTAVAPLGDCSDPEGHSVDFVTRAMEANRVLSEKTGSTAYIGTKDDEIVVYQFSLAPRNPPNYVEFEQSLHGFLDVAAELKGQIGKKIRRGSL